MLLKTGFNIVLALAVGGWVLTLVGATLSVMAFDAPGSQARWQAWAFIGGMCVLCLATLAAIIAAKWLFENERIVWSFALLAAPAGIGGFFFAKKFLG